MTTEPLVFTVDDEMSVTRLIKLELAEQGFRVATANSPDEVMDRIEQIRPDVVLLDVTMPGISGYELLREIRQRWSTPVIFVSARDREVDRVRGLEMGADDYVVKPFGAEELGARIRAVLRRVDGARPGMDVVTAGALSVDLTNRVVLRDGEPVTLTRTEWMLLQFLAANAGKVMLGREILARVWGPEYGDDLQYLRVWVSRVRSKIGDDAADPRVIRNLPGIGYQFIADAPVEPEEVRA